MLVACLPRCPPRNLPARTTAPQKMSIAVAPTSSSSASATQSAHTAAKQRRHVALRAPDLQ
jgi:hypothetical protein